MNNMIKSECWLGSSLTDMLASNRHTDCIFIVETSYGLRIYPGHKLIYSCASEVFERMLYGSYQEAIDGRVTLTDVEPKVFEKFREYIYSGSKLLNCYELDTIFKLLEFGDKYLVKSIKMPCVRQLLFLKDTCTFPQLLRIFQYAHTYNCPKLLELVSVNIKLAARHSFNICHVDVCDLTIDAFKTYLKIVQGIYSEPKRFSLIELYISLLGVHPDLESSNESDESEESRDNQNSNLINSLVKMINFKEFLLEDYYAGPGKSKLLSIFEKYEILGLVALSHVIKAKCSH